MGLFKASDIAIDLGSSNTLVYVARRGIVISEPTLVVVSTSDKHKVRAIGDEASYLLGRTSDALTAIRPLENGIVTDFDTTEVMLRYFIRKAIGVNHVAGAHVLISIPVGLPAVSRKAIQEAARVAGAKKVVLVEKPLAAAIGSGLPVYDPIGSMVVDIGGGTTDAAVVSLGGVVASQSIPVGGIKMDESIINYLKKNSSMVISAQTAEDVKKDLASPIPLTDLRKVHIRGRDLYSAHAMDVEFNSTQAHDAISEPCKAIVACINWVLARTPPELAADVMRSGIYLTGGGAKLFALDQFIARKLVIPVQLARQAEDCTIAGLGHLIENPDLLAAVEKNVINE